MVDVERLGLTAGAIESKHQLTTQPLSERELGDERLELGDEARPLPELEVGVDALLDRLHTELLEPADLCLGEGLERQIREWRSPPERERLPQLRRALQSLSRPRLGDETLEAAEIDTLSFDVEDVTRRTRYEQVGPEQLAKLRDEVLQRCRRRLRRLLTPELVDKPVCGHDLACAHQQEAEKRPLLLPTERDRAVVADDFERSEDPEVRHLSGLYHPSLPLPRCR